MISNCDFKCALNTAVEDDNLTLEVILEEEKETHENFFWYVIIDNNLQTYTEKSNYETSMDIPALLNQEVAGSDFEASIHNWIEAR